MSPRNVLAWIKDETEPKKAPPPWSPWPKPGPGR